MGKKVAVVTGKKQFAFSFKENVVHVFPNPASEAVWVKTGTGEPIQPVKIFNSNGEVILRSAPNG